ncbi:hypothetical protein [Lysobacter enzymogenes]|uniref:hypothetical protein n=1 Tax=Lysobacter enzymogenes TaxID=69 RepID=UPI0019CFDBD8|nr:hypothetical protein [Lysobacter enzymogenes]
MSALLRLIAAAAFVIRPAPLAQLLSMFVVLLAAAPFGRLGDRSRRAEHWVEMAD